MPKRSAQVPRLSVQQMARRGYAEVSPETQRKIKRRGWGFFRWTWRLTYLSALGGLVWVGYGIYQGRTPADQDQPDPTKKTLVVLGMSVLMAVHSEPGVRWDGMNDDADST